MIQSLSPVFASTFPAGTYCVACRSSEQCRTCRRNLWLDEHTCRWCNHLLSEDEDAHVTEHGVFCGPSISSECRWLYMEWLARKAGA